MIGFCSYIAPDSPSELNILPRSIIQSVIKGICTEPSENGERQDIKANCFDDAVIHVKKDLSNSFLQEFFGSAFYAKYQVRL